LFVDVLKEHSAEDAAREASLVSNIIAVGLRVDAGLDSKDAARTFSQKGDASPWAIIHMNESLIVKNIENMGL
jgi:hypothetical protein